MRSVGITGERCWYATRTVCENGVFRFLVGIAAVFPKYEVETCLVS